jgi:cytochrome c553
MNRINNRYFLLLIVLINVQIIHSQSTWEVPDDKKQKVSPFKFDKESQQKGASVYLRNCVSCHGTPGKNNSVPLNPPPGDPATDKFQKQTDGALFYKITTGRVVMPSFKDVLTETERWQIISYIRSFNATYKQPEPAQALVGAFSGMTISLNIELLKKEHLIKIIAIGENKTGTKPVGGIELKLFAKRYFGNMLIDDAKITNAQGIAFFEYTNKLAGDSVGNIHFIIKSSTEGLDGLVKDTVICAGNKVITKSLIDTRAMWTIRSKAPIWLILAYSLVVIIVWSFLLYIIMQIVKINKLGKKKIEEDKVG